MCLHVCPALPAFSCIYISVSEVSACVWHGGESGARVGVERSEQELALACHRQKKCSRSRDEAGLLRGETQRLCLLFHHYKQPPVELALWEQLPSRDKSLSELPCWSEESLGCSPLSDAVRSFHVTSKGQHRSRQCQTSHTLADRHRAQDGVFSASLSGEEGRGQWVEAAGQTDTFVRRLYRALGVRVAGCPLNAIPYLPSPPPCSPVPAIPL